MTFADIPAGMSVFVDANTFIYYFSSDPRFGPPCQQFLEGIARQELQGFTSSHVVSDVAHRMMTVEAMLTLGWSATGIAYRLRSNHSEIAKLTQFRRAVDDIPRFGIQVLPSHQQDVSKAAALSQQHELLSGDALIVALMQNKSLTSLASNDGDFDRVPGLTRYAPA